MNYSSTSTTPGGGGRPQRGGPPLVVLGALALGLLVGGLGISVAIGGVPPFPLGSATSVQDFFRTQSVAVQTGAVAVFASSVPLAIYTATVSARLRQLGITAPGATIALAGGILAAGTL